jgi:peptide-N4-(N-acetyl-beta-glucosaminyl)asparagine amidase
MCSYAELYRCEECDASFRFGRFRSVPKLLETKTGRCGEFSDVAVTVFSLLGYDPRLVVDYTDHVWVELNLQEHSDKESPNTQKSSSPVDEIANRILEAESTGNTTTKEHAKPVVYTHADPSEGILDNPYLYEDNWKKSLTFIFAHKTDSVEDRSTIYSHAEKHGELIMRRGLGDTDLAAEVASANRRLLTEKREHETTGAETPELHARQTVIEELEQKALQNSLEEKKNNVDVIPKKVNGAI